MLTTNYQTFLSKRLTTSSKTYHFQMDSNIMHCRCHRHIAPSNHHTRCSHHSSHCHLRSIPSRHRMSHHPLYIEYSGNYRNTNHRQKYHSEKLLLPFLSSLHCTHSHHDMDTINPFGRRHCHHCKPSSRDPHLPNSKWNDHSFLFIRVQPH